MKKSNLRDAQLVMVEILCVLDRICNKHNIGYWIDAGTLLGAIRHNGFIPWDDDIDVCMTRDDYNKFINVAQFELDTKDYFLQTPFTDTEYTTLNIPCKIRKNRTLLEEELEVKHGNFNPKSHHGIYIDIFPYDKFSKKAVKRKYCERFLSTLFTIKTLQPRKHLNLLNSIVSRLMGPFIPKCFLYRWLDIQSKRMSERNSNFQYGAGIETPFHRAYFDEDEIFPLKDISFEGLVFKGPNKPEDYLVKMFGADYMQLPPVESRVWHHSKIEIND